MSPKFSPNFFIGNIQIGIIESASCFNIGNNYPTNFQSRKKHNQGIGNITGKNHQLDNIKSLLYDSKAVDSLHFDQEQEIPQWLKELIEENLKNMKTTYPS
ncbi:hypothetical protein [Rossellomorea sp. BNER]|uniref:hypothetical protein n=1 Tax=Rossellomorea sp. BNER TaxID=2962031 RepID=UPI003AF2A234|nr:hypothetical protein [Rossellomorea sp. BNER]